MPTRKKTFSLRYLVGVPVSVIIAGAVTISFLAAIENLRFIRATDQILQTVVLVRNVASMMKEYAPQPGQDILADLSRFGQLADLPINPWHEPLRVAGGVNNSMRIETDLPTRDCRRLAFYLMARDPTDLGLQSIEAAYGIQPAWLRAYPSPPATHAHPEAAVENACGTEAYARLGLVFRIR